MPRTVLVFSRMGLSPRDLNRAARTRPAALTMARATARTGGAEGPVADGEVRLRVVQAGLEASGAVVEEASVEVEDAVVAVVEEAAADVATRRMRELAIPSSSRHRSRICSIT